MEEKRKYENRKIQALGTLLLAGALCLTGCGSTESNADVMAADVQQSALPEDSTDSGSGGDSGITPQESGQSFVLPPLSTEAQTIDYKRECACRLAYGVFGCHLFIEQGSGRGLWNLEDEARGS